MEIPVANIRESAAPFVLHNTQNKSVFDMDYFKGCLLFLLLVVVVGAEPEEEKCGTGPACKVNWFCDRTRIDRLSCVQCGHFMRYCFTDKIPSRCQDLCKKNHEEKVALRVRKEEELKCEANLNSLTKNLTNTENQMYETDVAKLKNEKCTPNNNSTLKDHIPSYMVIGVLIVIIVILSSVCGVLITKNHKLNIDLKEAAFQPLADGPKPAEVRVQDAQLKPGVQVVQDNEPPRSCNDYELLPRNEPLDHGHENPA